MGSETDKKRLEEKVTGRIRTTMIGSLNAVEKKFSFLWSKDDEDGKFMYKLFQELRKNILDNGNDQINKAKEDFSDYEVEHMVYHTIFPTIKQERLRGV